MLCDLCHELTIYEASEKAVFVIDWDRGTVAVLPPNISSDLIRIQAAGSEDRFFEAGPCEFQSEIWSFRANTGPLQKGGQAYATVQSTGITEVEEILGRFTLRFSVKDRGRGVEEFTIFDDAGRDTYKHLSGPPLLSSCL